MRHKSDVREGSAVALFSLKFVALTRVTFLFVSSGVIFLH